MCRAAGHLYSFREKAAASSTTGQTNTPFWTDRFRTEKRKYGRETQEDEEELSQRALICEARGFLPVYRNNVKRLLTVSALHHRRTLQPIITNPSAGAGTCKRVSDESLVKLFHALPVMQGKSNARRHIKVISSLSSSPQRSLVPGSASQRPDALDWSHWPGERTDPTSSMLADVVIVPSANMEELHLPKRPFDSPPDSPPEDRHEPCDSAAGSRNGSSAEERGSIPATRSEEVK
ncbi:unnamed protein product [Pleuronectes platessa]|uniref:Uncharacterized protein n=1 Tax=Pleuronectes platessa TaxID=8262 RepID=A0A9N7Y9V6_PLEPL|nr:unnamed protein product [Pleuronectes platessa]